MRCIFCKNTSDNSKSVEHIIPESLGNSSQILPRGIVCDKCNNYFSRKVEKPFLESPAIKALRFHQAIPNKRRRVPPMSGIITPKFPVTVYRHIKGPIKASVAVEPDAFEHLIKNDAGTLIFPASGSPPSDKIISRFLAKAALEAMAQRLLDFPDGIDYLIDESQLDPIRNYARRGDTPNWPHYSRRIYDPDKAWTNKDNSNAQVVFEYDFLQTNAGEMYFVLALFGLEFALNLGGPEVKGYVQWLTIHNDASPLYFGKNSNGPYWNSAS